MEFKTEIYKNEEIAKSKELDSHDLLDQIAIDVGNDSDPGHGIDTLFNAVDSFIEEKSSIGSRVVIFKEKEVKSDLGKGELICDTVNPFSMSPREFVEYLELKGCEIPGDIKRIEGLDCLTWGDINISTDNEELSHLVVSKDSRINQHAVSPQLPEEEKSVLNQFVDGLVATFGKEWEIIKDTSYEVIKGSAEAVEGGFDTGLTVVADVVGVFNDDFKQKVIEVIKTDYSSSVMEFFEPLRNDSLENMGAEGELIKSVARVIGMETVGVLTGNVLGGAISACIGEVGTSIEKYYQDNGETGSVSATIELKDISGNGPNVFVQGIANSLGESFNRGLYVFDRGADKASTLVSATSEVLHRVTDTSLDMAGHFTVGVSSVVEGLVDKTVILGGFLIPTFKDTARDFASYDFSRTVIGSFFDSISEDSYLNNDHVGEVVEALCEGVGQIAPVLIISFATAGAGAPAVALSQTLNLGLLFESVSGRVMAQDLKNTNISYEAAFIHGEVSGAIEVAIEKLTGGIEAFGPCLIKTFGESVPLKMLGEGTEEAISSLIEPITNRIVDKETDLKDTYKSSSFWQGVLDSFIVGAATALIAGEITTKIETSIGKKTGIDVDNADIATNQSDVVANQIFKNAETAEAIAAKKDIVAKVDSGKLTLGENGGYWAKEMGNYGEMRTAVELTEKGWVELTRSPNGLVDKTMPVNGIDHVFVKDGKILIVDSKSGVGAHLGVCADGTKQLSDAWWLRNLDAAVGKDVSDAIMEQWAINPEVLYRVVSQVDVGEETVYKLVDKDGNIFAEGGNLDVLLKGNEQENGK